jgi:hypothetical protein
VYKDNSTYYKSNPDRLIGGVLDTFRHKNIFLKTEDIKALEEYVKGWVSIEETDNYKDIVSRVKGEAEAYVKEGIAPTEGKQGKISEPPKMASIIEKHTNLAQEELQKIFETFMEGNKDSKTGNFLPYKQWEDEGDFGKKALEDKMRAKLDTLLSSKEEGSLRGELETAIKSVKDDPKTKEQHFIDWRDEYNNATSDSARETLEKTGLESYYSDLVKPWLNRRKTGLEEYKALPIRYLDIGSKPNELNPIFEKLDELAPLGAGGQRRGIAKFLRDNQMQIGTNLQKQIEDRIASSKDLRELKVWRDAVAVFNQQILSKFPNWRPAKIELDRLLTPKRAEVGVSDKAVKRISELAGNLEVALVTEYVNFITEKEGFKEFGDWSIKEKGSFNQELLRKTRDFFTQDILDELTKLSSSKVNKSGNPLVTKLKQKTKKAFWAATGINLGKTFSSDQKNKYRNTISELDTTNEDDQKTLENIYNKAENKPPPDDWPYVRIRTHLLKFGNTEF